MNATGYEEVATVIATHIPASGVKTIARYINPKVQVKNNQGDNIVMIALEDDASYTDIDASFRPIAADDIIMYGSHTRNKLQFD